MIADTEMEIVRKEMVEAYLKYYPGVLVKERMPVESHAPPRQDLNQVDMLLARQYTK